MLELTIDQQAVVRFRVTDRIGNPATVEGTPEWVIEDEAFATVTAAPDGMSGTVVAADAVGATTLTVTADADLGAGVVPIVGVLAVAVGAGQATFVSLEPEAPTAKA